MDAASNAGAPAPALLANVFGTSRGLPLTYVERPDIDALFKAQLPQGKHLIVYGASGQGKSSLVRRHLDPARHVVVQSAPTMRRFDLYRLLLREAGVYVSLGRKRKRTKGVSAEVTLVREDSSAESETSEQTISIDLSNINDILRILADNGVDKVIVLDDFHLLRGKVQRQVAGDLKTLYERSRLQVIVVGVWRHEDKLSSLSGYLPGRSTLIDVDKWTRRELAGIVETGTRLLNVSFAEPLRDRLLDLAGGNVGLLQQLCFRVCQLAGVDGTLASTDVIADVGLADLARQGLVDATAGRYRLFIEGYASRSTSNVNLTKWIMHALIHLGPDALDRGVPAERIHEHVNTRHTGCETITDSGDDDEEDPEDEAPGTVRQVVRRVPYRGTLSLERTLKVLKRIERYQRERDINPLILSYDKRRHTLRTVDVGFLVFLRSTERDELVGRLPRFDDEMAEDDLLRASRGELNETIVRKRRDYNVFRRQPTRR